MRCRNFGISTDAFGDAAPTDCGNGHVQALREYFGGFTGSAASGSSRIHRRCFATANLNTRPSALKHPPTVCGENFSLRVSINAWISYDSIWLKGLFQNVALLHISTRWIVDGSRHP